MDDEQKFKNHVKQMFDAPDDLIQQSIEQSRVCLTCRVKSNYRVIFVPNPDRLKEADIKVNEGENKFAIYGQCNECQGTNDLNEVESFIIRKMKEQQDAGR